MAIQDDQYATKRQKIEKIISDRRSNVVALETIEFILQSVFIQVSPSKYSRDNDKMLFEAQNDASKIRYTPYLLTKLQELADRTIHELPMMVTWDKSISSLFELMAQIDNHEIKTEFIIELNGLVDDAHKDSRSSLLRKIWYDYNLLEL